MPILPNLKLFSNNIVKTMMSRTLRWQHMFSFSSWPIRKICLYQAINFGKIPEHIYVLKTTSASLYVLVLLF